MASLDVFCFGRPDTKQEDIRAKDVIHPLGIMRGVVRGEAALSGGVARRLLDRVREGGRLDGIPEEITRVLSAREVEVLLLLDEHLGTDEIAQRLFISEHTVRSHVKSLLRKLGVSSRREALERLETARG